MLRLAGGAGSGVSPARRPAREEGARGPSASSRPWLYEEWAIARANAAMLGLGASGRRRRAM
jgi:hypothetical protein